MMSHIIINISYGQTIIIIPIWGLFGEEGKKGEVFIYSFGGH